MACIFEYHRFLPVAPIAAVSLLQARALDISRMAKRVIKKVKRVCSKRGQPKGKPQGGSPDITTARTSGITTSHARAVF